MGGRRLAFWFAVAGVSILANFGMELLAERGPVGFRQFVAYTHRGAA
jgi:hypothetical protein